MKISSFKFAVITTLILLIPVYGNWQLLLQGEKAVGTVVKIHKESMGQLLSFYSVIEFKVNNQAYLLKGPENVEYPIGKEFPILYMPDQPREAIMFTLRGIYFNRYTSISVVIFILWMAFYLSFSPKSKRRKSEKKRISPNGQFRRKKLV